MPFISIPQDGERLIDVQFKTISDYGDGLPRSGGVQCYRGRRGNDAIK
jgi:hypothetical protein